MIFTEVQLKCQSKYDFYWSLTEMQSKDVHCTVSDDNDENNVTSVYWSLTEVQTNVKFNWNAISGWFLLKFYWNET